MSPLALFSRPQGGNGIAQLLAAVPAGILSDRVRRDVALRVASLIGLIAGLLYAWTLSLSQVRPPPSPPGSPAGAQSWVRVPVWFPFGSPPRGLLG